jgi:hypothetical protein
MAAGAVAVAACLVGTLVGWWSVNEVTEQPQPENSVSVPLPPVNRVANATPAQITPPDSAIETRPLPPERAESPAARPERRPAVPQVAAMEEPSSASPPGESRLDQIEQGLDSGEQLVDPALPASTAAATMPLPRKVIARTIQRIGYSCGEVASTSAVEGEAPGVYKVTCASGHSYQARPVNGRYHFRRWGRN